LPRYGLGHEWRNCVPYLSGYFNLTSNKLEAVWKRLNPGGLSMRDWAMLHRVEVSALLRLEKLGANGD